MQYKRIILTAAIPALLTVFSCSSTTKTETQPDKQDNQEQEQNQGQGQQPAKVEIAGTVILDANNGCGLVSDSSTGKGIPGVTVTDGTTCVQTDKNGVYQLKLDSYARNVYICIPSGYRIPLDDKFQTPVFYSTLPVLKTELVRNDFTLDPLEGKETKFTMVMIGDPQCKTNAQIGRYKNETIPDIKATLEGSGKYANPYAMTLGDIVYDTPELWDNMKASMAGVQVNGEWLPFFQCIGNHDHNGTRTSSDYAAVTDYIDRFGPTDYSFDRGDVHIVVMDDVVGTTSNGTKWSYASGFSDSQYAWLKQDLSLVGDKEDKMVFLCCHIPFRGGGASGSGSSFNSDKHYKDVLRLLTEFREAHIMTGHTHYAQNWIHKDYVCKGGQAVYEHVHQAACGAWWAAHSSVSGAPNGYNIYEIDGPTVVNWINKGTGRDAGYQLRVYDGNQIHSGNKGYVYSWFAPNNYGGTDGINAIGNALLEDCFVAEVWDDDDAFTTVEFWKDGKKVADFKRLPNGSCTNIPLCAYWFNEKNKKTSTWASKTASHYWYYKPTGMHPADVSGWEVKVTRTIPSSGIENVWTRSDFTTDYSEF